MDKIGNADMKFARGRDDIMPRDFAAAVKDCVDYCAGKFAKIHPNKKSGVISTIKAAFNFKADITDAQAEQIYKGLLCKKHFKECDGWIEW